MRPNNKNFCGGNFNDWLEVMLTDKCNGRCSWCVEKNGYKPIQKVDYRTIAEAAILSKKKNIILLGGEPTLYPQLKQLVLILQASERNVYITTNGSKLSPNYVKENLLEISGINISIHSYDLERNYSITGIILNEENLKSTINIFKETGATVRLNCNIIKGYVDSKSEIFTYIEFAKNIGANSIRFAELKNDENSFVDLFKIFGYKYGINNEPFGLGCNSDVKINEMSVNFRQMCGLQTTKRKRPVDPEQVQKYVLYYDGKIYNGWQTKVEEEIVEDKELIKLLEDVKDGKIDVAEASLTIGKELGKTKTIIKHTSSGGCQY